jgi:hypothetical protein
MVIVTLETEARVPEKAEGEVRVPTNPREAAAQRPAQGQDLGRTQVGEIASFDVAPDLLDGIEIRRIGGQALDVEPRALTSHVSLHASAPVGGQSVPEEDDRAAAEVPLEGPQERDQLAIGVAARARLEEDPAAPAIPAEGQRDGDREALPESAGMGQDGRSAPRRPRPPDDRVMREAALVLEEEPGPAAAGVVFTRGHRVRFHCAMAAASRSRACRTGRCTDQCKARNRYHTCPG